MLKQYAQARQIKECNLEDYLGKWEENYKHKLFYILNSLKENEVTKKHKTVKEKKINGIRRTEKHKLRALYKLRVIQEASNQLIEI